MNTIFIHKGNNTFNINNVFQCTIDAFQKLEPTFEFPQNYTEILYNEDTEQANYIKTEFGLQALSEELRNIFSTFTTKIQEYELTLTTPIYKKHIETQEIKQFAFLDTIDSEIWADITEEEITEYLLSIAKKQKIAEVKIAYENMKNVFVFFIRSNEGEIFKYDDYKIDSLIYLCNEKIICARNRVAFGTDTMEDEEFTDNNEFKFVPEKREKYDIIPLSQEKLANISHYLQILRRKYKDKQKEMLGEIKALINISDVQNYQISFADLPREHDFTNIIFS
ncbi:MAG: hypothetical protein EBU90_19965 [Proteobacteria bacterium]|nr:hypothetical protein [Pseudomonadota bacterium]